jgi:hypothetical protein
MAEELAKRQLTGILAELVFAELGSKHLTWNGIPLTKLCFCNTGSSIILTANVGDTHDTIECRFVVVQKCEVPPDASEAIYWLTTNMVELIEAIFGVVGVLPPLTHIVPKPTFMVDGIHVDPELVGTLILCFIVSSVDVKSALEEKEREHQQKALTEKEKRDKKKAVKAAAVAEAAQDRELSRLTTLMKHLDLPILSFNDMQKAEAVFKFKQASLEQAEFQERQRLNQLEFDAVRQRREEERKAADVKAAAEAAAAAKARMEEKAKKAAKALEEFRAKNVKGPSSGSSSLSSSRDGSPPPTSGGSSPSPPPSSGARGGSAKGGDGYAKGESSSPPPPSSGARGGGAKGGGGK